MPRFLLDTSSSDSDYNADFDYAVVQLTQDSLDGIAGRTNLLQALYARDRLAYELYFWGACTRTLNFYDYDTIEQVYGQDNIAGLEAGEIPNDLLFPADAHRWECLQEIYRIDQFNGSIEVAWTVIPKHSDIYITTAALDVDKLMRQAAETTP